MPSPLYSAEVPMGNPPRRLGEDDDSGRGTGQDKGRGRQGSNRGREVMEGWQSYPTCPLGNTSVLLSSYPLTASCVLGALGACQRNKPSSSECRAHQARAASPAVPLRLPAYPLGVCTQREGRGQGKAGEGDGEEGGTEGDPPNADPADAYCRAGKSGP